MVDIGSVIRAAGAASRLPGRAINGPFANASPPRAAGAGAGRGAAPAQSLPQANSANQTQVIDALTQRVAQLESRLAALESVLQAGAGGATLSASGALTIEAATVRISAGTITFESGMTSASGVLRTDTLVATSVVASSYTPGAGNIW
jgi:hypothetical protein